MQTVGSEAGRRPAPPRPAPPRPAPLPPEERVRRRERRQVRGLRRWDAGAPADPRPEEREVGDRVGPHTVTLPAGEQRRDE